MPLAKIAKILADVMFCHKKGSYFCRVTIALLSPVLQVRQIIYYAPAPEVPKMSKPILYLDGYSLTPKELFNLSSGSVDIALTPDSEERIKAGREVVDRIVESGEVVYGINTGFGLFSNVTVSSDKLGELQVNLIRSHSSGVGEPLTPQRTRMLLALRINVLAKGHSGISLENTAKMIKAFNAGCLPMVPCKGTVGASGDLAPLSHLALGLIGEGKMHDLETGKISDAATVLKKNNLEPIILGAKEGLAMINGTQLIASLGAEAVCRSYNVARCADVATALSLEVLCGTVRAYHPLIHKVRPHVGQQVVATRVRTLLQPDNPSSLFQSHQYIGKVQDAYSLRCAPQVHGIANDTIEFVNKLLTTELNSATDNPMVFTAEQVKNEVPFGFDIKAADPTKDSDKFSQEASKQFEGGAGEIEDITDLEAAKKEIAALRATVAEQKKVRGAKRRAKAANAASCLTLFYTTR